MFCLYLRLYNYGRFSIISPLTYFYFIPKSEVEWTKKEKIIDFLDVLQSDENNPAIFQWFLENDCRQMKENNGETFFLAFWSQKGNPCRGCCYKTFGKCETIHKEGYPIEDY